MRTGQWVAFAITSKTEIPSIGLLDDHDLAKASMIGAHKAGDSYVGVYERDGRDPVSGQATPAIVVPVMKLTGANIETPVRTAQGLKVLHRITFLADSVVGLAAVTSRDDIPAGRLPDDLNWQPQP